MKYFKRWVIKIQFSVYCQNVNRKPTILSSFQSLTFLSLGRLYQQREQVEEQMEKELTSIKLWSLLFVPDRENKDHFQQLLLVGQSIHSTNTLVLPVFSLLPLTVPGSKVVLESLTVPPVLSDFHPCGLAMFSRKLRQNSNWWHFKFTCTLLATCPIACSNFTAS